MMKNVKIFNCKNGYYVHEEVMDERHAAIPMENTSVFETFDGLVTYLREHFEGEKKI